MFTYLGNTSYEGELDIDNKLNNFLKIAGILNNVFRPQKTLKKTRIKTTASNVPIVAIDVTSLSLTGNRDWVLCIEYEVFI